MEDLELMRSLRLREDDAIETLYDLYGADVYSLLSKMKGGDPSELTVKTFEAFAQSISEYDPKSQTLWAALMGHARRVNRKHSLSLDRSISVEVDEKLVDKSILKPVYSEIVDKTYLKGMALSQVAKSLNIPESTVRTRFRLAINSLKNKYDSDSGRFLSVFLIVQLFFI